MPANAVIMDGSFAYEVTTIGAAARNMRLLIRELVETVILGLVIFLGLQFSIQNFRVEGASMQPTLEQGQYIVVNKLVYLRFSSVHLNILLPFVDIQREEAVFPVHAPARGEVAIFRYPKDPTKDFVKRVIGIPGDVVEIRYGQVYLNGEALEEPYITHPDRSSMTAQTVPPGSFFTLGDNRRNSDDSRDWGTVPSENFIGRAWISYWPLDRLNTLLVFGRS